MYRNQSRVLVLFLAITWMLAHPALSIAEEKSFDFQKDIDVVPANEAQANNIKLSLSVDKTKVEPGEKISVHFHSEQDAYLRLLDIGTSGKITQIWPNKLSGPDNRVKAGRQYSFGAGSDRYVFKVGGPKGLERIVAVATDKPDTIIREGDLGDLVGDFKSYHKGMKDIVVQARQRIGDLPQGSKWGTACVTVAVGGVPGGGRITSRNVYCLGVGAATMGLHFCDSDVKSFSGMIAQKLGIPEENTRLLFGPDSTRKGFAEGIRWLASKTQPEDLVFIYFSGHGTLIPDPPDISRDQRHPDGVSSALVCYHNKQKLTRDDPDLKRILLTGNDLAKMVKEIPARRKLVVIDACHSGSITKDISPDMVLKYIPLLSDRELREIRQQAGRQKELQVVPIRPGAASTTGYHDQDAVTTAYQDVVTEKESLLAACAKPEPSYEDRNKKAGLFTYWLVKNISERTPDLQHAFQSARDKVMEETKGMALKQTPQLMDDNGLASAIKFQ